MSIKSLALKSLGLGINTLGIFSPERAGKIAFKIFAKPPKPRIKPKESAFLAAAERIDIEFEGKNIAVFSWGDPSKPYIFTSYGWAYNSGRWRYYVPPLVEAGFRVIAYDPPGHGMSDFSFVEYPMMVRLQTQLIKQFGRPKLFLGHSFGSGCFIGTMHGLPPELRPERVCIMGSFSEARYIFHLYRRALGLSQFIYRQLTDHIYQITGQRLSSFDNARLAADLEDVDCLLIHDPKDPVTTFSNAIRNHAYWPGSYLYRADGSGHHLGTTEVTEVVINWLVNGIPPTEAEYSYGQADAHHELRQFFLPLEQDTLHGRVHSTFYS